MGAFYPNPCYGYCVDPTTNRWVYVPPPSPMVPARTPRMVLLPAPLGPSSAVILLCGAYLVARKMMEAEREITEQMRRRNRAYGVTTTRRPAPRRVTSNASWTAANGNRCDTSADASIRPSDKRPSATRKSSDVHALVPVTMSSP